MGYILKAKSTIGKIQIVYNLSYLTRQTDQMIVPLAYHRKVTDCFKQQPKTWDYFSIASNREEQLQQFKHELLKNTYKFDPITDARIYDRVTIAKEKLELDALSVTVYQAQHTDELNASIAYWNGEAHIVFSGAVTRLLNDDELLAVIAHELTHIKLYSLLNGELETADRIITAIANNYDSEAVYQETARLFRLYTEIFCDRGAFLVLQDINPVISSLVKVSTGLDMVNADNYLKQSEDIFITDSKTITTGAVHPENFIRAQAIRLWQEDQQGSTEAIARMIEGPANLDRLDLFRQRELSSLTRIIMQLYLKPKWFRTTLVTSLARQYFPDFTWDETALLDERLMRTIAEGHTSVKDYISYLLLDFALADPELDDVASGWAIQFADGLQLNGSLDPLLKKEFQLSDKKLQQYKQKMLGAYHFIKESENEQVYE